MTTSTDFLGGALYAEFSKQLGMRIAVTQMIFIPETSDAPGSTTGTPFCVYRRRISTDMPRRNWRFVTGGQRTSRLLPAPGTITNADVENVSRAILSPIAPYLESMSRSGWTLRKKPFVVEFTADDIEPVKLGKTPYKVLGRVQRTRKYMGYPEDLLELDAPAPAVPEF